MRPEERDREDLWAALAVCLCLAVWLAFTAMVVLAEIRVDARIQEIEEERTVEPLWRERSEGQWEPVAFVEMES